MAAVGKQMCESPIVKKVTFTGSTPVAKLLAGMAASTLKKLILRLAFDSECLNILVIQSITRSWRKRPLHSFR